MERNSQNRCAERSFSLLRILYAGYAVRGCVLNVREIVRAVRTSVQRALREYVLVCMCVLNSELLAC